MPAFIPLAEEKLTVDGSATPITAATLQDSDSQPLAIEEAVFTHVSGGNIFHSSLQSSISNAGANGENFEKLDNKWVIRGLEAIKDWEAIKESGASDATVNVTLYGRP